MEEITRERVVREKGPVEEVWIDSNIFENWFTDTLCTDGYSAASMKAQTKRMWQIYISSFDGDMGDTDMLLILLQQKDGTFYCCSFLLAFLREGCYTEDEMTLCF